MKTILNFAVTLAAVSIFSICSVSVCSAVDKFVFTPKLNGQWKMDSNFFKAEEGERPVDTYLLQPGVELGYETAKTLVTLDATLNYYKYMDQGDVPLGQTSVSEYDYTGYTGIFDLVTLPTQRFKLLLSDHFTRTRDQAQSDRFSNAVDLDEYFINRLTGGGFYDFNDRFAMGLRYKNQMVDYEPETREDSIMNRGVLDIIYNVSATALVDLNYQYYQVDYSKFSSDYVSNQVSLEFKKQFRHLNFTLAGGFHNRDFTDELMEDMQIPVYLLAAEWRNPPDPEVEPVTFASFTWERNLNDLGYTTGYTKSNRADLKAGHTFAEKFPVEVTGTYLASEYKFFPGLTPAGTTENRDDTSYKLALKAGYIITHWLTLFAEGGTEQRDSNLVGYGYDNTYGLLRFESAFNFGAK